jgi:hypothetical protein
MRKKRLKTGDAKGHVPSSPVKGQLFEVAEHRQSSGNRAIDAKWTRLARHQWRDDHHSFDDGHIEGTWKAYQPYVALARVSERMRIVKV